MIVIVFVCFVFFFFICLPQGVRGTAGMRWETGVMGTKILVLVVTALAVFVAVVAA